MTRRRCCRARERLRDNMDEFCAMHGALARSLRSLRPQADLLKAAARGVLILARERLALLAERLAPLRARLAAAKRARAERLSKREENPHRLIARLERHIPHRIGV